MPSSENGTRYENGIRCLDGKTDVLVIAPHGHYQTIDGKIEYRNDWRTGIIAEEIHKILGCFTIINDAYIRPDEEKGETPSKKDKRLDLFKIGQAKDVPDYLNAIENAVKNHEGKTLVVWLHGLAEKSAKREKAKHIEKELLIKGEDLHALIGYGQGKNPHLAKIKDPSDEDKKSRLTAKQKTVDIFCDELTELGLQTLITRDDASSFRGRDPERLNQLFLNCMG